MLLSPLAPPTADASPLPVCWTAAAPDEADPPALGALPPAKLVRPSCFVAVAVGEVVEVGEAAVCGRCLTRFAA